MTDRRAKAIIAGLTARQRNICARVWFDGWSHERTAQYYELTAPKSVTQTVCRAKAKLREHGIEAPKPKRRTVPCYSLSDIVDFS